MAIDSSKQRLTMYSCLSARQFFDVLLETLLRGSFGVRSEDVTLRKSVASDWVLLARENSNLVTVLLRIF